MPKCVLDEVRLIQVTINDVDAKHVIRACLDRRNRETAAVARNVEDSPTTERASTGLEQLGPTMPHECVYPSALHVTMSGVWQVGA